MQTSILNKLKSVGKSFILQCNSNNIYTTFLFVASNDQNKLNGIQDRKENSLTIFSTELKWKTFSRKMSWFNSFVFYNYSRYFLSFFWSDEHYTLGKNWLLWKLNLNLNKFNQHSDKHFNIFFYYIDTVNWELKEPSTY